MPAKKWVNRNIHSFNFEEFDKRRMEELKAIELRWDFDVHSTVVLYFFFFPSHRHNHSKGKEEIIHGFFSITIAQIKKKVKKKS